MDPAQHHNALNKNDMLHWYRIESILGQGGFGITYLARDTNLDQPVAIKEYLPTEFSTRDNTNTVQPISENHTEIFDWGKQRFLDEAKTLAQFRHPNVVRVNSFFENNNTGYMVMEYEEGDDLAAMIKSGESFEESRLLELLLPILDGLEQIHQQGFIHRDIKPANIFIRHDGSPVLIDFGSARQAIGGQTRTLTSLVTPGFAPFEQYHDADGKQGPWTDIYALGATAYSMLTGKPPVDAIKRGMAKLDHSTDAYLALADLKAGKYSEPLLQAIDQALAFKEVDRPQSVAEWRGLLKGEVPVPQAEVVTELGADIALEATAIDEPTQAAPSVESEPEIQTEKIQATEKIAETVVAAKPTESKGITSDGSANEQTSATASKKWIGVGIIGLLLVVGVLAIALNPDSSPEITPESENTATNDQTPEASQVEAGDTIDSSQAEADAKVALEKLQQEEARIAEEKEKLRLEKAKMEADKKAQAEAKLKVEAEAKKKQQQQAETKRKAKLKKEAEEKKKQQELARKKEAERKAKLAEQARLEAEEKAQQKSQKVAVSQKQQATLFVDLSGRYVPDEGFEILEITQKGDKITAKIGTDQSTLTGERVGDRIIFEFNYSRTGYGYKDGYGEFQVSADGMRLTGVRSLGGFPKNSEWNLTREIPAKSAPVDKPQNLYDDISGIFVPDEGFEDLEITQKGNKITAKIGTDQSTLKGTRKGNTITFTFNYSRTGYGYKDGYGKFVISPDGKRLNGVRSLGGFPKNSVWNLSRKPDS
ncbi:MAG: protein kinase [Pseudomonadota bacterium]